MTSTKRVLTGLALFAFLASASTVAIAQAPAPSAGPGAADIQAWRQKLEEHRQERTEAEAKRLHDVLNLRPDQDAALHTLLAALTPTHGDGQRPGPGMEGPREMDNLTTPERLDKMTARMAEHQAAFQQRAAAIKQFYAALSPEQQRAFDALHGLRGQHMGPRFGHMGRGMGPQMGMGAPEGPDLMAEDDTPAPPGVQQ